MDGVIYSYLSICFNLYNELLKQKTPWRAAIALTGLILDSGAGETKGFLYACLQTRKLPLRNTLLMTAV